MRGFWLLIAYLCCLERMVLAERGCCSMRESSERMITCVNGTLTERRSARGVVEGGIEMAVFASSNIFDYAAHSLLVMSFYAEIHGYGLRLLGPETGDDFSPHDRRWNKIKSIIKALTTWATHTSALVYYDADLVVTEIDTFSIERVLHENPQANLIMSADALDVANTGFIVVRNTPWTLAFFQRWWAARNSELTYCDQHVFNKLFREMSASERGNIAILTPNAVNSRWPAIETFDEHSDRVLHLMGETHPYRVSTFKNASAEVCAWLRATTPVQMPRRLKFSQQVLTEIAKASLWEERERVKEQCVASRHNKADDMAYQRLHEATTHVCDDRRPYVALTHRECHGLFQEVYHINLETLEARDASAMGVNIDDRIFFLDQMTKALYGIIYFSNDAGKEEATANFLQSLVLLEQYVDMNRVENQVYVEHKRAILFGSLARHHKSLGNLLRARERALAAVAQMELVLLSSSRDSPDFSGFILEYIETCSLMADICRGQSLFDESLSWVQQAEVNAQVLYTTYSGEGRVLARSLADLHLLEASLLEKLHRDASAMETLKGARRAFISFDAEVPRDVEERISAMENRIGRRRIMESVESVMNTQGG